MVEQVWIEEDEMIVNKKAYLDLCDFKRAHENEWNKWKKKQ